MSNILFDIRVVRICFDDLLEVDYLDLKENIFDNGRVNIFVVVFIICWVRLKLYSYLN